MEISGLVAAVVGTIGLIFIVLIFFRLRNAQELSLLDGIYTEISRGLKEYNVLNMESPNTGEERGVARENSMFCSAGALQI
jgi:hypothetical protein